MRTHVFTLTYFLISFAFPAMAQEAPITIPIVSYATEGCEGVTVKLVRSNRADEIQIFKANFRTRSVFDGNLVEIAPEFPFWFKTKDGSLYAVDESGKIFFVNLKTNTNELTRETWNVDPEKGDLFYLKIKNEDGSENPGFKCINDSHHLKHVDYVSWTSVKQETIEPPTMDNLPPLPESLKTEIQYQRNQEALIHSQRQPTKENPIVRRIILDKSIETQSMNLNDYEEREDGALTQGSVIEFIDDGGPEEGKWRLYPIKVIYDPSGGYTGDDQVWGTSYSNLIPNVESGTPVPDEDLPRILALIEKQKEELAKLEELQSQQQCPLGDIDPNDVFQKYLWGSAGGKEAYTSQVKSDDDVDNYLKCYHQDKVPLHTEDDPLSGKKFYREQLKKAAESCGIPYPFFACNMFIESRFNSRVNNGIAQMLPPSRNQINKDLKLLKTTSSPKYFANLEEAKANEKRAKVKNAIQKELNRAHTRVRVASCLDKYFGKKISSFADSDVENPSIAIGMSAAYFVHLFGEFPEMNESTTPFSMMDLYEIGAGIYNQGPSQSTIKETLIGKTSITSVRSAMRARGIRLFKTGGGKIQAYKHMLSVRSCAERGCSEGPLTGVVGKLKREDIREDAKDYCDKIIKEEGKCPKWDNAH